MGQLFETHRALLEKAVAACRARTNWSAFPESASPRNYGETAKTDGDAAYAALLAYTWLATGPGSRRGRARASSGPAYSSNGNPPWIRPGAVFTGLSAVWISASADSPIPYGRAR